MVKKQLVFSLNGQILIQMDQSQATASLPPIGPNDKR
jgi:hypothetical protein